MSNYRTSFEKTVSPTGELSYTQTIVTDHVISKVHREFGIKPEHTEEENDRDVIEFSFINQCGKPHIPFNVQQDQLAAYLKYHVSEGCILLATENYAVYPAIHMVINNNAISRNQNEGLKMINGMSLQKGLFRELKSINHSEDVGNSLQNNKRYILLGFKTLDTSLSQVLIESWKDWTCARYIYMNLPEDLGLTFIKLYHREYPTDVNMFMYIVLVECINVDSVEKQETLLNFVQRLRVERIIGFVSLYECLPCDNETSSNSSS